MTLKEKLAWLEANQPGNVAAINAVRAKLGLKPLDRSGGRKRLMLEPYMGWQQRGRSSN